MADEPTGTGYWLLDTIRDWWRRPPPPDPWDAETDDAVNQEDAVPICHHCTEPQAPGSWFCPQCGTAVGAYNNVTPYQRVFSIGEVLRAGVDPRAHYTWVTLPGYVVAAVGAYFPLAPFYLFRIFRNMGRQEELPADSPESNDEAIP